MKRDLLHLGLGLFCGLVLAALLRHWIPAGADADLERYREVREFVKANYVRSVGDDELLENALHGMVENLDRYSRFLGRQQVAEFERETGGRYRGIGVVFKAPTSEARVLFCLRDSPGDRAGIRPGDRILTIDGVATSELSESDLQQRISRSDATSIELEVASRANERRHLELERVELVDPSVRHERMLDEARKIAYVSLVSFSHQTPDEFDRAFESLAARGARALIVDLRGNPGGVLLSAVRIANRFLSRGVVVSTEGRGEPFVYEAAPSEARYAGLPLVVLVDQDSASASEVLAGALQDHRAAVIVGAPTYGKGTVQKVHGLGDHEASVKLTNAYYYTPAHRNLERSLDKAWECGLVPDVAVEVSPAARRNLHAWLASYSPPENVLADLERWEREESVQVIPEPPDDPALDAALALLRGERPTMLAESTVKAAR